MRASTLAQVLDMSSHKNSPHTPFQLVAELRKQKLSIHFSGFWRPFWKFQGHQVNLFLFSKSSKLQLFMDIWIMKQLLITAD